jgi:hypothetical protein
MFEKFHRKSLVATGAALISALGVGGIAVAQNQASSSTPPAPSTATPSTPAADTPDAPDTPGAADTPEAGDKADAPGAADTPEAGDKADAAGGKDAETNDGPDTDNVQSGDQSGPETPDAAAPVAK